MVSREFGTGPVGNSFKKFGQSQDQRAINMQKSQIAHLHGQEILGPSRSGVWY